MRVLFNPPFSAATPVGAHPEPLMPDYATQTATAATGEGASSISILLVEDEYTLRDSCANVLRLEGYAVTPCGHGREALQVLSRRAFDVALIDLYLDDISGL